MLFKGLFIDWSLKVIPVRRVNQELLHSLVQFSMDSYNAKLLIFRPDLKTNCLFYLKFRQKQLSCRIHPCPGLAQWRTDEDCPPPARGRRWSLVIIAILIDRNIIIIVATKITIVTCRPNRSCVWSWYAAEGMNLDLLNRATGRETWRQSSAS